MEFTAMTLVRMEMFFYLSSPEMVPFAAAFPARDFKVTCCTLTTLHTKRGYKVCFCNFILSCLYIYLFLHTDLG